MPRGTFSTFALGCGLALAALFNTAVNAATPPAGPKPERRVALVIGNSKYQSVTPLPNPVKDAGAIAELFSKAGFEVVKARNDVGNLEFKRALREFVEAATDSDIAVVYYAGHGIQIGDMNYMIPVDAKLAKEFDAKDEAVSLERIIEALEPAKKLRLLILDACRDNPFLSKMQRRVAMRATQVGGLGNMEPTTTDTLIAYAAKAGSTAEDGDGANSPFAAALIKHITEPGLDVRLAFGRVRDDVRKATGGRQEPFMSGSLGGTNISLVPAPSVPVAAAEADVRKDYELVASIGTKKAWEVFINTHKTGFYVDLAKAQIAKAEPQAAAPQQQLAMRAVPPVETPAQERKSTNDERRAWDRVKDSGDRAAVRKFIEKYPSSPLVTNAERLLDTLERSAQEREEKVRAEREAREQREAADAERKKTEREAARQREAEEKRAKAEEADRKKAEREAARQREDEEKRAKAAAKPKDAQPAQTEAAKSEPSDTEIKAAESAKAERAAEEKRKAEVRAAEERRREAAREAAEERRAAERAQERRRAAERERAQERRSAEREKSERRSSRAAAREPARSSPPRARAEASARPAPRYSGGGGGGGGATMTGVGF
jgi:uncharacterized caspase-like protein